MEALSTILVAIQFYSTVGEKFTVIGLNENTFTVRGVCSPPDFPRYYCAINRESRLEDYRVDINKALKTRHH